MIMKVQAQLDDRGEVSLRTELADGLGPFTPNIEMSATEIAEYGKVLRAFDDWQRFLTERLEESWARARAEREGAA